MLILGLAFGATSTSGSRARGGLAPSGAIAATLGLFLLGACGGDDQPGRTSEDDSSTGPSTSASTTVTTTSGPTTTSTTSTSNGSGTDTDPPTETDTEDDTGSSTSTGDPMFCPPSHACIPEAPKGWEGPIALAEQTIDGEETTCPEAYPSADFDAFDGLAAPPASCGCSCGQATGTACTNSTTLNYWAEQSECSGGSPFSLTVFGGTCSALPSQFPDDSFWQLEPVRTQGGACLPESTETLEDPTWQRRVAGCGGGNIIEDVCASGRTCAPLPGEDDAAEVCIWRSGEHECPDDFDTERMVFGGLEDQRGCMACSCSSPTGLCDNALVRATATSTCMPPFSGSIRANNECVQTIGGLTGGVLLDVGDPLAFCSPSQPAAVGEAVGVDATTVCCVSE